MTAKRKIAIPAMARQILSTAIILSLAVFLLEVTDIDLWVQDYLFNFELQQWVLDRDDWLTKFIFYDGIKKLFIIIILAMLIGLIFFRKTKLIQNYKQGLLIVCISALAVTFVISALKTITNVPCPKDISRYGGNYPHVTVSKSYPDKFQQLKKTRCYPAGHAAGGFALLSLFFLFKKRTSKILALITVMSISWSIGGYKMLIGDHFLSHTVVSMILAWLLILIIAKSVFHFCRENGHTKEP